MSAALFDKYDKNHSGTIDLAELKNLVTGEKLGFPVAEIEKHFKAADKNHDGKLDKTEFTAVMAALGKK